MQTSDILNEVHAPRFSWLQRLQILASTVGSRVLVRDCLRAWPATDSQLRQRPRRPSALLQSRWNSAADFCWWHLEHSCTHTAEPQPAQSRRYCWSQASAQQNQLDGRTSMLNSTSLSIVEHACWAILDYQASEKVREHVSSLPCWYSLISDYFGCKTDVGTWDAAISTLLFTVGSLTGPRAATLAAVAAAWQALQ